MMTWKAGFPTLVCMTVSELAEATETLQEVEGEILETLRQGRLEDYPALSERLTEARERYDELVARSFQTG